MFVSRDVRVNRVVVVADDVVVDGDLVVELDAIEVVVQRVFEAGKGVDRAESRRFRMNR